MPPPAAVDPSSGYCAATKIFHSLRAPIPLPPPDLPLSFPALALSLLPSPLPSHPALVDSDTGEAVPFPAFLYRVRALTAALRVHLGLSDGDVAFVLAPRSLHVPVLYYALMAVGAVVSPANPALTAGEVSELVALSRPSIAFAVRDTAAKLPPSLNTMLLDTPGFLSFLQEPDGGGTVAGTVEMIHQSDPAAILYSSGTTGRAKAAVLTHRNLIASASAPGAVLAAQTLVFSTARRFDARTLLTAVGRFRVARLALAPRLLLAIDYDCPCGHAAGRELRRRARRHRAYPEGYGLTETTAGFCRAIDAEESARIGSVGRHSWGAEAKIVHPGTGASFWSEGLLC